jgi:hypothetical protein
LRPGGRIGIADIVADDSLTAQERGERGSYAGCIAGALSFSEFRSGLEAAGLQDVSLTVTHDVADRMRSVIVRARRPGAAATDSTGATGATAPAVGVDGTSARSCSCGGACG